MSKIDSFINTPSDMETQVISKESASHSTGSLSSFVFNILHNSSLLSPKESGDTPLVVIVGISDLISKLDILSENTGLAYQEAEIIETVLGCLLIEKLAIEEIDLMCLEFANEIRGNIYPEAEQLLSTLTDIGECLYREYVDKGLYLDGVSNYVAMVDIRKQAIVFIRKDHYAKQLALDLST